MAKDANTWYEEMYSAVGGTDRDMILFLLNVVTGMLIGTSGEEGTNEFIKESIKIYNNSKLAILEYMGYRTTISFDDNIKKFSGIIEDISDSVYFECDLEDDIEKEFILAVDEYIEILNR